MANSVKPVYITRKIYKFGDPQIMAKLSMYQNADLNFWAGTDFVSRPRYGTWNVWDFDTEYLARGPSLVPNDQLTFDWVTDQRSQDLLETMRQQQCRVAVLWSGGIDSSVVLASLIRNWQPADLSQIDVIMNTASYYENPVFYHNVIERHGLRVSNINELYQQPFQSHIVTDGEPADKLWLVKIALNYAASCGSQILDRPWQQAQTDLICFFHSKFDSKNQCSEYFDLIAQNIRDTAAPVETVGDWFWWINFNWHWDGHLWYNYAMFPQKNSEQFQLYQQRYQPWFRSDLYQQWSFSAQGKQSKRFDSIMHYKWPAKQYIDSVAPNSWFMEFKTKSASSTRYRGIDIFATKPVAIFNDGTAFTHTHSEKIHSLVQNYLLI